jgi:hypothetical protein
MLRGNSRFFVRIVELGSDCGSKTIGVLGDEDELLQPNDFFQAKTPTCAGKRQGGICRLLRHRVHPVIFLIIARTPESL